MALNLGTLYGTLELRDKLTGGLDKAANKLTEFGNSAAQVGTNMNAVFAGAALTAFATGVTAAAVAAVSAFASFETQMKMVQGVLGATGDEMKKVEEAALKLGTTTMFSAEEAAKGMLELARAGLDTNQIIEVMPNVMNLAAGAQMDLAQATEIAVNVLHGFNLGMEQSARVADVMTMTANKTATDVAGLGVAFKYAGPVAASAGLDFEQTAAALGLLANAGFKGSMGGTALRGAITRLLAPTDKAETILRNWGVTAVDAAGKMLPLDQIITQLAPHVEDTAGMMEVFGQRAGPGMIALINQGLPALQKLTAELKNAGGAAAQQAAIQMEGLSASWTQFKNTAEVVAIQLGSTVAPAITAVVKAGVSLLQSLAAMPDWAKKLAAAIVVLAGVIGPLLIAFGLWNTVGPLVMAGMAAMTLQLKGLVVSVFAAGTAIRTGFISAFTGLPALAAGFVTALNTMAASVMTFATTALASLRTAVMGLPALLGTMATNIGASMTAMVASLKAGFVGLGSTIAGSFTAALAAAKAAMMTLITTIGSLLTILAALAAAFAVGYAVGSIIRAGLEFIGFAKYVDQATAAVYNFFAGIDENTSKGKNVMDGWSAAQKKVYEDFVAKQREAAKAAGMVVDANGKIQTSVKMSGKEMDAYIDKNLKLKQEQERLEKATQILGVQVTDLALAEKTIAKNEAAEAFKKKGEEAEKAAKKTRELTDKQTELIAAEREYQALVAGSRGDFIQHSQMSGDDAVAQVQRQLGRMGEDAGVKELTGAAAIWEKLAIEKRAEQAKKALADTAKEMLKAGQITQEQYDKIVGKQDEVNKGVSKWQTALQGIALLAGLLPGRFGESLKVIGNIGESFKDWKKMTGDDKFAAVAGAAGQIGGLIGGKAGGAIQGAAGGAMTGAAIGTIIPGVGNVVGGIVGGLVGALGGLFGSGKKKAEELKKKQDQALDAFGKMFDDWKNARKELAAKGAAGVNLVTQAIGSGELPEGLANMANAAVYVGATFEMLRRSGLSVTEAFELLKPSLEALQGMSEEELAGTGAAPLLEMMTAAQANEALLNFTSGIATTANALAGFGMLTQEIATRMSLDLGGAIQSMIDSGVSREAALALNAQALFDLNEAAKQSGVTLDAHTQKLIDDAEAAGLFKNLVDPMDKLVEVQNAMLVATGELVKLFGGAVPDAVQKMIDEFNNTKVNVNVNVTGTTTPPTNTSTPPEVNVEGHARGTRGIVDFGKGYATILHGEEGVVTRETWDTLGQQQAAAVAGQVALLRQDLVRVLPFAIGRSVRDSVAAS